MRCDQGCVCMCVRACVFICCLSCNSCWISNRWSITERFMHGYCNTCLPPVLLYGIARHDQTVFIGIIGANWYWCKLKANAIGTISTITALYYHYLIRDAVFLCSVDTVSPLRPMIVPASLFPTIICSRQTASDVKTCEGTNIHILLQGKRAGKEGKG